MVREWSECGLIYILKESQQYELANWIWFWEKDWGERENDTKVLNPRHWKVGIDSEMGRLNGKQVQEEGREAWFCNC